MTAWLLARRTLCRQWTLSLLTAFCVAVAASVFVGAFAVGDSVQGSLYDRLVTPLGSVRYAMVCPAPISADRAAGGVSAALRLRGSASDQESDAAGGVSVWGIEQSFENFIPGVPSRIEPGKAWITAALAHDLGLGIGDPLFVSVPKLAQASPAAVFAHRKPEETTVEVAATVMGVLPESVLSRFSLEPVFRPQKSVFVNRAWLAARLGRADAANVLLGRGPRLTNGLTLEDYGLKLAQAKSAGGWVLHSDRLVLSGEQIAAAEGAAVDLGIRPAKVSVALAFTIAFRGRRAAHVIGAWIEGVDPAINAWSAEDLAYKSGGRIDLDFLAGKPDGTYGTIHLSAGPFRVLPTAGLAAEPAFVPAIEGVTDAARLDNWNPPFEIDRSRITARDEAYWDTYRAAPRLFLTQAQLRDVWGGTESITGLWLKGGSRDELESAIAKRLEPTGPNRWTVPVRENAVRAAQGSTDMRMLILALGVFVLAGALGLAATAFSLAVQQQTRALAILRATGVPRGTITRVVWLQGGVLSLLGGALGIPGGIAFASASILALGRLSPSELGLEAVELHVHVSSALVGAALAGLVSILGLSRAMARAGREPLVPVLRGQIESHIRRRSVGTLIWLLISVGCFSAAVPQGTDIRGLFVGGGLLALAICAIGFALSGRRKPALRIGRSRMLFALLRESAESVVLAVSLSALATFVLAVVSARLQSASPDDGRLLVRTSVPARIDFGTEVGRKKLGFNPQELLACQGMSVSSFLASQGDDVSCLNPAAPTHPRFLAVSPSVAKSAPFQTKPADAWQSLLSEGTGTSSPALADEETLMWTLKSSVGGTMKWHDDREVRFVGVLEGSPLAREILVSESDFREAYPDIQAPNFFLVTPPKGGERAVLRALSRALAPLGPEIRSVREELAALRGVQNAYVAIFLALGALGLLLGVVGAAFVGFREALARRSRYALLRALGLPQRWVATLALAPGLLSGLGGVIIGMGASAVGSYRGFSPGSVALMGVAVLLVLSVTNLVLYRMWTRDKLVEALRCE